VDAPIGRELMPLDVDRFHMRHCDDSPTHSHPFSSTPMVKEIDVLFHVRMAVRIPRDTAPDEVAALNRLEHERAKELQDSGKWEHLWRVAGQFENVSIFRVDSPAELHDILNSLPLYPFMEVQVTALCHHPGSIRPTE
jgi:muconolactone D-isomerase